MGIIHRVKRWRQGLLFFWAVLALASGLSSASRPTVWGEKPVLAFFLFTPAIAEDLRSQAGLNQEQLQALSAIALQEAGQIGALEAESQAVLGDPQLSPAQKAAYIEKSVYNEKVRAIVHQNQAHLRLALGTEAYDRLARWVEARWAAELARLGLPAGKKLLALLSLPKQKTYPRSFEVYATRFEAGDRYIVALPDKCLKFANGGTLLCNTGYQFGQDYSVAISYKGRLVAATVADAGPWNVDDNYWSKLSDPQPRRMFADLPLGLPAAQAAYFNGYNGGLDQFGRLVTSPVAIDISYAVADDLELPAGNTQVTVSFLWTEGWGRSPAAGESTPPGADPGPAQVAPYATVTPNLDGSIVHIVQPGQTLTGIANVYGKALNDILALNQLTLESIILPGDRIIVKPADPAPTATPSILPKRSTRPPTSTATSRPASTASPESEPRRSPPTSAPATEITAEPGGRGGPDPILAGILLLLVVGAALFGWGLAVNHKR